MTKINRSFTGCKRDLEDKRDYRITKAFARTIPLPDKIDYSGIMGPVRDQGSIGSCVGFACAKVKHADEKQEDNVDLEFSPLFIYWQRPNQGSGMYPRDAMKILQEKGCCLDKSLPYENNQKETGTVPPFCIREASNFKIKSYARVIGAEELKRCLVEFGPTFIAIPIYESFLTAGRNRGIVPMPDTAKEALLGGHAMCCVGFDTSTQMFKVMNSWGQDWGDNGYCYIPFNFINTLCWDIWQTVDAPSEVFKDKGWLERLSNMITQWISKNTLLFSFIVIVLGMVIGALLMH